MTRPHQPAAAVAASAVTWPGVRSAAEQDRPAPAASPAGGLSRRIARDLRPRAETLAILSGKGGVGKTNVAVNLAISLASAGRRVLLVDADLGLANVDLVLGQRPRGDLGHVLSGKLPLEAIVQEGPAGVRWIPGASHMPALARLTEGRREAILQDLESLEAQHDYILLDGPAGLGSGVLYLARQADGVLLVTTPEPTAMMDAYTTLKAAAGAGGEPLGQVRLVVNMVTHRRDAERAHRRIAEVARRFLGVEVELLGYVFCDGHVGRSVQRQQPLVLAFPHSQAAWCLKRLSVALMDGSGGHPAPKFAFFRRLAKLFAATSR